GWRPISSIRSASPAAASASVSAASPVSRTGRKPSAPVNGALPTASAGSVVSEAAEVSSAASGPVSDPQAAASAAAVVSASAGSTRRRSATLAVGVVEAVDVDLVQIDLVLDVEALTDDHALPAGDHTGRDEQVDGGLLQVGDHGVQTGGGHHLVTDAQRVLHLLHLLHLALLPAGAHEQRD